MGIGCLVGGVAVFEGGVMRSPKADVSLVQVVGGVVDAMVANLFRL